MLNKLLHGIVYTLLNRCIHSVIDDIIGQLARSDNTEAAPPAEEANQVPPGELNEWSYIGGHCLECFGVF